MPIALAAGLPAGWTIITNRRQLLEQWRKAAAGPVAVVYSSYMHGPRPPRRAPPDPQAQRNLAASLAWSGERLPRLLDGRDVMWACRLGRDPTLPPSPPEPLAAVTWAEPYDINVEGRLTVYGRSREAGRLVEIARFTGLEVRAVGEPDTAPAAPITEHSPRKCAEGSPAVTTDAAPPPETHSGMAGRPSAKHLYLAELERRHAAGQMAPKVAEEARALFDWLSTTRPELNAGSVRTIENNIRDRHRELKKTLPK